MLQAASLYFQAEPWKMEDMTRIMWSIIGRSLEVLSDELLT